MNFTIWIIHTLFCFDSLYIEEDPTSDPSPSFTTPRTTLQKRTTKKTGHFQWDIPQPPLDDINLKPMARDEPVKEAQPSLEYLPPVVEAVNEALGGYPRENPSDHVNLKPQAANVQAEVHARVQEKAGTGTPPRPLAVAPSVVDTQQVDSPNLSFLPPFEDVDYKVETATWSYFPAPNVTLSNAVEALPNGIIADVP